MVSRRTALPYSDSYSLQLLGEGSGQVVRRIRREAGRFELVVSTFL